MCKIILSRLLPYRHSLPVVKELYTKPTILKISSSFNYNRNRCLASGPREETNSNNKGNSNVGAVNNQRNLQHFKSKEEQGHEYDKGNRTMPHPIWTEEETLAIKPTHREPENLLDRAARLNIRVLRTTFDIISGFVVGKRTEKKWIRRVIFLESVAGVPGMVGAMMRHLKSLRVMKRDHGWIHTLLQEAENERMHLMTAMQVTQPGTVFRSIVVLTQLAWLPGFSLAYLISPRYCHRFVGYLEEEAVKTYTKCLEDIDDENSPIAYWKVAPAPEIAIRYWQLSEEATLKDVILAIRADEDHHREVNHTLACLKADDFNPYYETTKKAIAPVIIEKEPSTDNIENIEKEEEDLQGQKDKPNKEESK